MTNSKPYVLAITGASAQQVAERCLYLLLESQLTIHLVLSKGAHIVWQSEIGVNVPVDSGLQEKFWRERLGTSKGKLICHKWNDHSASIASGSFRTKGMIVLPCTMGTIGRIASGISSDLIERCADVHLKENRPLILAPRETPLSLVHLRNLTSLTEAGAKIYPLIPSWYSKPETLEDIIDFLVIRLFDHFDEELKNIQRWQGGI
ncbi:flavin prenyltransferase UbiX [Prochlorococcus sp. MIT 1300]|uniref:flavin prenyltransferase UbiX n=1 Tax=Prochlorococcus sp. MIT 1300 TaxID=3096218 RepID=UPI002A761820|nr:flavin prenyltransferase UbiX [Prochlorococcus sp. MIT 1300]